MRAARVVCQKCGIEQVIPLANVVLMPTLSAFRFRCGECDRIDFRTVHRAQVMTLLKIEGITIQDVQPPAVEHLDLPRISIGEWVEQSENPDLWLATQLGGSL